MVTKRTAYCRTNSTTHTVQTLTQRKSKKKKERKKKKKKERKKKRKRERKKEKEKDRKKNTGTAAAASSLYVGSLNSVFQQLFLLLLARSLGFRWFQSRREEGEKIR